MAGWHVNPETGDPSRCNAEISCPYGSILSGHATSKAKAAKLYEEFQEALRDPKGAADFYFVADEDHERFTGGECGDLAAELHRHTGYPIVVMGATQLNGEDIWDHVAVRAPDGRILDVTGVQPESRTRKAWGYPEDRFIMKTIESKEINSYLSPDTPPSEAGSPDAEVMADRILKLTEL